MNEVDLNSVFCLNKFILIKVLSKNSGLVANDNYRVLRDTIVFHKGVTVIPLGTINNEEYVFVNADDLVGYISDKDLNEDDVDM